MTNLAIKPKFLTIFQQYGYVTAVGHDVTVQTELSFCQASLAPSCLLAPLVGDKVLLVTDTQGGDYVLAVLERAAGQTATLRFSGNTEISAASGSLSLSGRDGVALTSARELSLTATALRATAINGEVTIENMSVVGGAWRSCVDSVKSVGRTFDSVLERCHQRVARSYRQVDEMDQVKAGQIDYQADTSLQLHAKYALVTADELVKMDAEQIHLG